jgi:hypothetical protein
MKQRFGNVVVGLHDRYCTTVQVRVAQIVFWGGLTVLVVLQIAR